MRGLRKPVPAWLLLATIAGAAAVTASVYLLTTQKTSQPDFALTKTSDAMILLANGTALGGADYYKSIDIRPVNNFTGIVSMSVSSAASVNGRLWIESSTTGQSSGDQILLGPGQTLWMQVSSSSAGNFSVVVTGTSGRLSHSVTVNLIVRGLAISANPNPATFPAGSSSTSQLSLTSLNGLSGNFTVFYLSQNNGLGATGPAFVVVGLGQTVKFNVTISISPSYYGGRITISIDTPAGIATFQLYAQT